jgi:nucleoside-diphosphate-sugar epimerase
MRIVITGATGNVGTALLRRLTDDGGHRVLGLARRIPEVDPYRDEVEWASVDLTKDSSTATLRDRFEGADAVVHLAWGFQPSHDLAYLRELGVGGTRRVVEAVEAAGVPHLVHQSSLGAYSPKRTHTPVDETWPTDGIPTSRYSRHKAAAERILDSYEASGADTVVTRMRPGIIGQRSAGSALLRYGVPGIVPAGILGHIPVLPMDRRLVIPMVHADDVADAFVRVLEQRAGGAFNLAAPPPLTTQLVAAVLDARAVHVPAPVVRALMSAAWHARLQQVDTGWLDMGFATPLLDTSRAERVLGWSPTVDAMTVLREVLDGMREGNAADTPVLRRRTVPGAVRDAVRRSPVGVRSRP